LIVANFTLSIIVAHLHYRIIIIGTIDHSLRSQEHVCVSGMVKTELNPYHQDYPTLRTKPALSCSPRLNAVRWTVHPGSMAPMPDATSGHIQGRSGLCGVAMVFELPICFAVHSTGYYPASLPFDRLFLQTAWSAWQRPWRAQDKLSLK